MSSKKYFKFFLFLNIVLKHTSLDNGIINPQARIESSKIWLRWFVLEFNWRLQPQEHAALIAVEDVELRQHLADIIAADVPALLPAVRQQPLRAGNLVVVAIQIDAGEHAAVQHPDVGKMLLVPMIDKHEGAV